MSENVRRFEFNKNKTRRKGEKEGKVLGLFVYL
jgi:hypothetical protein